MRRLRSIFVFLGAFVVLASLTSPGENDVRTPYDESETLPYENALPSPSTLIEAQAHAHRLLRLFDALSDASSETGAKQLLTPARLGCAAAAESLLILDCALRR